MAGGASLVLLVFFLGWSSTFTFQQSMAATDRVTLKVNSLVAVDKSLSGHYMLASDSLMAKDTIRFSSWTHSQLPKKIQLASGKKYLIVDDDIVFLARGIVDDDIVFADKGIVDDDIVFLNLSKSNDTTQAPLPQGTGLIWDELSLRDTTLQLISAALADEKPAFVFARDLCFTLIDQEYLTIMGFKYDEQGKAEKGVWKFKLTELKGLYKAKASEHIFSQWKELWLYKKDTE